MRHQADGGPFTRERYRFTTGLRAGQLARIHAVDGTALLSFRSFASIVGIVAALVSGIVIVAGAAAGLFLLAEGSPVRALVALALTTVFVILISTLVPRVQATLYHADKPALTIAQTSVFPGVRYVVSTPEGGTLASFRKSVLSRLGRNRWTIHSAGHVLGYAAEESLRRALLRKLLGKFSRRYEANVRVVIGNAEVARIIRRGVDSDTLELVGEADRRVLVALATLVLCSEP